MKFKNKVKSHIKELREEYNLSQQELADKIGVSRQTIYYLEKGSYNPSLTISFKIAEVFDDKRLKEIFYQEPVIKDILKNKTLEELDRIASKVGITTQKLIQLTKIDDDQLNENYSKQELEKIAKNLDSEFDDLFEE
ncbi:MAG: transcriptional regulator [Promethearchaeota archaeon]|nr:MAG: transcriptional regulator [Candidatus Lokiarchaeota archaeon]